VRESETTKEESIISESLALTYGRKLSKLSAAHHRGKKKRNEFSHVIVSKPKEKKGGFKKK